MKKKINKMKRIKVKKLSKMRRIKMKKLTKMKKQINKMKI